MNGVQATRSFHLVLIKPSHYDDEGYVIQWARSSIPANSLATVYGLALDCAERKVLGHDVEILITAVDETNTRVRPSRIIREIQAGEGRGLVCLVGVQSNQFPRAVDIARPLRGAGIPVCIGGFHVSGSMAMLPELTPELREARDLGITLFAGEAEGRFEQLLQSAYTGTLEPIYNFMSDLPGLEAVPPPYLPAEVVRKTRGMRTSFDAGRGCPFLCSFCTIINVQGRKSRSRSADDVERIVRANLAQGINNFFITDDNLARNQNWEAIFDRLIKLREEEGQRIYLMAQVDTMCHKIRGFIEKAWRAGVTRVFIGLENINPDALKDAHKGQNRITEYRSMLQAWHRVGALTYAGYILGFPGDTPASIERDIGIIQRELPVDILEFFILTPLPGSADHKKLYLEGVEMDGDLNKYDLTQVTTRHPLMSSEELTAIYHRAWKLYFSPEHVETILRRTKDSGYNLRNMMMKLFSFEAPARIERVHPLEAGIFRRKYRRDRRPGLPLENPCVFYVRFGLDNLSRAWSYARMYWRYRLILKRVERDSNPYSDLALTPVQGGELESLELYTSTRGGEFVIERMRRRKALSRPGGGYLYPDLR
ncbi:MAG: radical SAM protein [Deltaproteobacteria bacterium RIFCSPLOWO2_12_FULL_57_22]|nr:MAG: radical SAM protein [Deltaproteobacteria bacterium RIFCSPLOWO2_12_FULL_57_22]